jgi:hypothetical protein
VLGHLKEVPTTALVLRVPFEDVEFPSSSGISRRRKGSGRLSGFVCVTGTSCGRRSVKTRSAVRGLRTAVVHGCFDALSRDRDRIGDLSGWLVGVFVGS